MQKQITIVYHSHSGHTKTVADIIRDEIAVNNVKVFSFSVSEAIDNMDVLHASDTIVFGCPTMFGSPSAAFKQFMEHTGGFWYKQLWKDKFAAGFTVSSTVSGDKLNTLMCLNIFAAQHSMHWINLGVLPRFLEDRQTEGQNRLGCYLGLMMQSDNGRESVQPFPPGDLLTAELFAKRLAQVTLRQGAAR